jgi:hypothetical protein
MKTILFALGAFALLAEPVAAMPVYATAKDVTAGALHAEKAVTAAGAAHRSNRRTSRRVTRRHI